MMGDKKAKQPKRTTEQDEMNANQKMVAQYVAQARRQNAMHVKTLVLGYATAEFDFTVKRNVLMKLAREVKANPNLGVR